MKKIILFLLVSILMGSLKAQVSISGLTCVIAGGENGYLYTISGPVIDTDYITWTVTGGTIATTGTTIISGTISAIGNTVRIVWTAGASNPHLVLSNSRLGTTTVNVTIISINNILTPSTQVVSNGASVTITGGGVSSTSCLPQYDFWWESATDSSGAYEMIEGASGKNLQITSVVAKKYYRRALSVNGNTIYSNTVLIDLQ